MRMLWVFAIGMFLISCTHIAQGVRPTWDEERWGEIEQQQLDSSCGLASLLTIMRHHYSDNRFDERSLLGAYISMASDEALKKAMRNGLSFIELEGLARSLGYAVMRKMLTLDALERVVAFVPVLVYLEIGALRHFAVVRGAGKEMVWLADPARGNVYHSRKQFLSEWRVPEALRHEWKNPGGLVIIHPSYPARSAFLASPPHGFPPSFFALRRQMLLGR